MVRTMILIKKTIKIDKNYSLYCFTKFNHFLKRFTGLLCFLFLFLGLSFVNLSSQNELKWGLCCACMIDPTKRRFVVSSSPPTLLVVSWDTTRNPPMNHKPKINEYYVHNLHQTYEQTTTAIKTKHNGFGKNYLSNNSSK